MIVIYDFSDSSVSFPYSPRKDSFYITHAYDGVDTLHFECSTADSIYPHIVNEATVETEDNKYIIKNIDERGGTAYVDCTINLDDWKNNVFNTYRRTNTTISSAMTELKPAGWTVTYQCSSSTLSKRTTIEEAEDTPMRAVNPLEVLAKISEVYGVTYIFNAKAKTLIILEPEYYSGVVYSQEPDKYFTDELNLRSLGFTGNSDEFATRLYAYGAIDENGNALTFADINDGKEYIEDFTYSNKVVCMGWSDERYTVKSNLLAAARAKLAEVCNPVRSYECDVINFNNDMWLFRSCILIDRNRRIRVKHICVEYTEYPEAHELDVCTLATVAPDVRDKWSSYLSLATKKTQEVQKTTTTKVTAAYEQEIERAMQLITGNSGGYKVEILNAQGKPQETLYMDTDDIDTAKYVLRLNKSGIGFSTNGIDGPYNSAWTIDGTFDASKINVINLNASNIITGTIKDAYNRNSWNLVTGEFITKYGQIGDFTLQNGRLTYGDPTDLAKIPQASSLAVRLGKGGITTMGRSSYTIEGGTFTEDYAVRIGESSIYFYDADDTKAPLAMIYAVKQGHVSNYDEFQIYMREPTTHASSTAFLSLRQDATSRSISLRGKLFAGQDQTTSTITGNLTVNSDLRVIGTKNRVVSTEDYGDKLLYSYETAAPMFGDVGEGVISEEGTCHVFLDPVLAECIQTDGYQVFIQKYGEGECYVSERNAGHFIVSGTAGLKFGWELKAKQKEYENNRLETLSPDNPIVGIDYGDIAAAYIADLTQGRLGQ